MDDSVPSLRQLHDPVINQPTRNWTLPDFQELWDYRNLIWYMVSSGFRTRYKQTVLGIAWAIINPLITMVVFTVIFGRLANLPSYNIPYPIFSYSGLVPWTLFVKGMTSSATSIVGSRAILDKIYIPRLTIPLSQVFTGLVDFMLSFTILLGMVTVFSLTQYPPPMDMASAILPYDLPTAANALGLTWRIIFIPFFMVLAMMTALGVGLGLSALHVRFRDIGQIVPFMAQLWLYLSPVAYPSDLVSGVWRALYSLNPMVAVCDGFRWALLGLDVMSPTSLLVSTTSATVMFVVGATIFQRMQARFPDLI